MVVCASLSECSFVYVCLGVCVYVCVIACMRVIACMSVCVPSCVRAFYVSAGVCECA